MIKYKVRIKIRPAAVLENPRNAEVYVVTSLMFKRPLSEKQMKEWKGKILGMNTNDYASVHMTRIRNKNEK